MHQDDGAPKPLENDESEESGEASEPLDKQLRDLVHRWFVRYNPLYFFSAASMLLGVYLVSRGLDEIGWRPGKLLLVGVVQVYEILLIGGAILLFRHARLYRPAVILGLLEVFFLFDSTFETEVLLSHFSFGLSVSWVALAVVKLAALAWAFRLRVPRQLFALCVLAAAGLAITPRLLDLENVDRDVVYLLATWFAVGLLALLIRIRLAVSCDLELDDWGQEVLRRSVMAAALIWGFFYFLHFMAWTAIFDVELSPLHVVPVVVMVAFLSQQEGRVWAAGFGALIVTSMAPYSVAPTALVVAVVLAVRASDMGRRRLYVGMVAALYVALWAAGWRGGSLPEPAWWLNLVALVVLVLMAWRLRLLAALLPLPLGFILLLRHLPDLGALGWGVVFLAAGFIALLAGLAVNWSQRRRNGESAAPARNQPRRGDRA